MGTILALLLAVWLIVAVLGFVINGLLWMAVLSVLLLVGTATYGFAKGIFNTPRS